MFLNNRNSKRIASLRVGDTFGDSTPALKYNLDSLSRNLGNHLGSSNVLVDEYGTLVNFEEYYPFGETSFGSYAKKRYRFCGKEKDEESGMYYYGARYYSPWLCRFISVDPLAGKYVFQSPYVYADDNPINKMDYNGEGTEGAPSGGGNGSSTEPIKTNDTKATNKQVDNVPGGKLNIIVDQPEVPREDKSKIAEYEQSNPEKASELKREWDTYEKDVTDYPKLKAIKDRIDNATPENDPVINELKEKLIATAGEKNITLKTKENLFAEKHTNQQYAQTANISSNNETDLYILFDLKLIDSAPSEGLTSDALIKATKFNKTMGAPNDPRSMQIELGGIIAHELGHALDFYSKNGNFFSKDKKTNEVNPQQYEYNYYIQKHLPAYYKK